MAELSRVQMGKAECRVGNDGTPTSPFRTPHFPIASYGPGAAGITGAAVSEAPDADALVLPPIVASVRVAE